MSNNNETPVINKFQDIFGLLKDRKHPSSEITPVILSYLDAHPNITLETKNEQGDTIAHLAYQRRWRDPCEALFKSILDRGFDLSTKNSEYTLMELAIGDREWDTVKDLIERGAKNAPFWLTVKMGKKEMVQEMIQNGVDIEELDDSTGDSDNWWRPIFYAVTEGHTDIVKILLEAGATIDDEDAQYNAFPLDYAPTVKIAELLISHGAELGCRGEFEVNAVYHAARLGHLEVVKLLVEKYDQDFVEECEFGTPLGAATSGKHLDVATYLVEKGAPLTTTDVLRCATDEPKDFDATFKFMETVIAKGVDLEKKDEAGKTPFLQCLHNHCNEIAFKVFLKLGARLDARDNEGNTALHIACGHASGKIVKELLAKTDLIQVNATNKKGETALHVDLGFEGMETFKALIDAGADVDAVDASGNTPILAARHSKYVQVLAQAGADINAANNDGNTKLHLAYKDYMTKTLLDLGANKEFKNKKGETPLLHFASSAEDFLREGVFNNLVSLGLDINAVDQNGDNIINLLLRSQKNVREEYLAKLVEEIIKSGCKINDVNKAGESVFAHAAAVHTPVLILQKLLSHGAQASSTDAKGNTALHLALQTHGEEPELIAFPEMIEFLTQQDLDVNALNKAGETALVVAMTNMLPCSIIRLLIDNGSNVNLRDENGDTALHHLCRLAKERPIDDEDFKRRKKRRRQSTGSQIGADTPFLSCVKYILQQGGDPSVQNNDKETPVMLASETPGFVGDKDVVNALLRAALLPVSVQQREPKKPKMGRSTNNNEQAGNVSSANSEAEYEGDNANNSNNRNVNRNNDDDDYYNNLFDE